MSIFLFAKLLRSILLQSEFLYCGGDLVARLHDHFAQLGGRR
jgi:hypothetical protein